MLQSWFTSAATFEEMAEIFRVLVDLEVCTG